MTPAGSDPPRSPAVEPPAALLRRHRPEILRGWGGQDHERAAAGGPPEGAFLEHLPYLFDRFVETVDAMSRGAWRPAPFDGVALRALGRFTETRDVRQLLERLSALRSIVLELAWKHQPEQGIAMIQLLGQALDETMREAVDACSVVREQVVKALGSLSSVLTARTARVQVITSSFAATLKMPEVARIILDQGLPLLDAEAGSIALIVGDEFELIGIHGYGAEGSAREASVARWRRCPRDVSAPTADAVRAGAPVWIESREEFMRQYPELAGYPAAFGHSAWAGLPLILDGRPIGVIGLSFARGRSFAAEEKAFAVELAQLCAQALGRAQLYEEVEAARARAEELVQSRDQALAVLDSIYDTAPVGLALLDRELRYVRINDALAQLNGFPPAEHLGKRIGEVLSRVAIVLDPHGIEDEMRRVLESGEPRLDMELSGELSATPGVERCWLNSWYPVRVAGQIAGLGVVVYEITAQKRAAREGAELIRAQAARAEAQATARATNDFLAVLSHELRTPLQSMLGWTQVLKDKRHDGGLTEKGLLTIERNIKAQTHLIEDLLDVSRILTGKLFLASKRVDVAGVVASALESARTVAAAKSIQVEASITPAEVEVLGDPDRLQQIFSNLLSNALKFTPRGGRIGVRVERDSVARIVVDDTGCGIAPAFLPHVFERFRQADSSTTRAQGGLGLGLALVRHLVELHGGTVTAESPGEGRGATLTVTLPLVIVGASG